MQIFVFDTETTGFINKKEIDLDKQPRIVQFAGILGTIKDGEFTEEKRINLLINPGMPIPFGSSEVHHIYDIDIKGAPEIKDVIDDIMWYINTPDIIIGHNIEYDESMIQLELKRLNKQYKYQPKQIHCTMKETVDFCALQGNGKRFKYPKLGELHKKLFDKYFIGAHDAMTDVEATLNCFIKLVQEKVIIPKQTQNNLMQLF